MCGELHAVATGGITIDTIDLASISLTSQSSDIKLEIASICKVKTLCIQCNSFTDGCDLSLNSTLEKLYACPPYLSVGEVNFAKS